MARPATTRAIVTLGVSAVLVAGLLSGGSASNDAQPSTNAGVFHAVGTGASANETLRLGATSDCDSFDPAISYDAWCQVIIRLYARNLMSYAGAAGSASTQLVPDLASGLPRVSEDQKTWQFSLTPGLLWNDGTPITSADVRYTVERLFASEFNTSTPTSSLCLFSDCPDGRPTYTGPFVKGATDLASIITPDENTVIFALNRPFAEFANVVASTNFAIVQRTKDLELRAAGGRYATSPSSSGPFVLAELIPGNQATFVRNEYWDQETDGIRRPKVEQIQLNVYSNVETVNAALNAGEIELKVDGGIDEAFLSALRTDPANDQLIDHFAPAFSNFLVLNDQIAPLDNLQCREAINLALNRELLAAARGDVDFAVPSFAMAPSVLSGTTASANFYDATATGDVAAARKALSRCGRPGGFELSVGYLAVGSGPALFDKLRVSLARIGIVVNPVPFESASEYFVTGVGSPETLDEQKIGAALVGWGAIYDSPFSFWSRLVDGRKIAKSSNVNYALFDDEQISLALDNLETKALSVTEQRDISTSIEKLVATQRRYLPYANDQLVLYRPRNLTNVYVHWALAGQYDLVNIGIVRLSD